MPTPGGGDWTAGPQNMVAEATGLEAQEILPISTGVVGAHSRWISGARRAPPWLSLGSRDAEGTT